MPPDRAADAEDALRNHDALSIAGPRRAGRPYWEENGFTTEWFYHRYRLRTEPRMPLPELAPFCGPSPQSNRWADIGLTKPTGEPLDVDGEAISLAIERGWLRAEKLDALAM